MYKTYKIYIVCVCFCLVLYFIHKVLWLIYAIHCNSVITERQINLLQKHVVTYSTFFTMKKQNIFNIKKDECIIKKTQAVSA